MEINKTSVQQRGRKRLFLIGVLVVLAVALGIAAAVRSWIRIPELPVPPVDQPAQGGQSQTPDSKPVGDRKPGVYTFLVAGKDVASNSTDTMLLLTYDTNAKTVTGLNLPRDTMMNVTTASKRLNAVYVYNRGKDKATYTEKGMAALKAAVQDLTGVMPDFYVMVEWEAIGELVDAVGGVEFEVPFDMDYDDPYQDPPLHIHQKAGLRTLSGDDAMQVIRWRKNNDGSGGEGGDIARLGIQQNFLKAVVKKCLQPAIVLKFTSLVEIFKNNVETDLTVGNILAFAEQAIGMNPESGVSFMTAPLADSFKYNKAALVTLDPQGLLDIVNGGINPYTEDIVLEDLEIVVRKSDGYFTVTSGEIAENINDFAKLPSEPKPEPKPEPAPEPAPEPEEPTEGELPEGEEPVPEQPGDVSGELAEPEQPGEEQPEPDVPGETEGEETAPEQPAEPVEEPETPAEEEKTEPSAESAQEAEPAPEPESVAVLPPRPIPVQPAA